MKDQIKTLYFKLNRFGIVLNRRIIPEDHKPGENSSKNNMQVVLSDNDRNSFYESFENMTNLIGDLIELSVK